MVRAPRAYFPDVKSTTFVVALLIAGAALGCRDNQIAPEHPAAGGTVSSAAPPTASVDFSKARAALATPNAATGTIELVIPDRPTSCGPLQQFPKTCERASRVRIDLTPAHQHPGTYPLGPELSPWSYRDAQDKSGGAWGAGKNCQNLGDHFVGSLQIVSIESDELFGVLSGTGELDGPFRAQRCASCKGTGMECTTNAECCNDFCHEGRCQP
jgi:hypothetical protein